MKCKLSHYDHFVAQYITKKVEMMILYITPVCVDLHFLINTLKIIVKVLASFVLDLQSDHHGRHSESSH